MLFHVTANDDWSNLPLSGLFVDMLRRLVALAAGVQTAAGHAVLAPVETLDGFGLLSPPPQAATGLAADKFGTDRRLAAPSAGPVRTRKRAPALNLSACWHRPKPPRRSAARAWNR